MFKKISQFWNAIWFFPKSLWLKFSIQNTKQLLSGKHSWFALDRLGVPGFGNEMIRIDFPPEASPKSLITEAQDPHPELLRIISKSYDSQLELLQRCLGRAKDCLKWPINQDTSNPALPWSNNTFMTMVDMISLYGIIGETKPSRYMEIGSGISTRVASQARKAFSPKMEIVSIDPSPRLEVESLCNEVVRRRLEEIPSRYITEKSGPEAIVFFDGSHRCFPGSDVTIFFLKILPRLKPGTLVHIHDIYLPEDYPNQLLNRYWSEQYVLAAYLLGGESRCKVVMPCHFLATASTSKETIERTLDGHAITGSSFWFEITE